MIRILLDGFEPIIINDEEDIQQHFSGLDLIEGGEEILIGFFNDLLDIDTKLTLDVKKNIHPAYNVLIDLEFGEDKDNNTAKIGMYADSKFKISLAQQRMFDTFSKRYFDNFIYLADRVANLKNQNI